MWPTPVVTFDEASDSSCLVEAASIVHGRGDPTGQPEADVATLELVEPLPAGVDIASPLTIYALFDGTPYPRFDGKITDIRIGWDSVDQPRTTVTAAGNMAGMGRKIVGDAPWPQETDGARVNRIIGLSGVPTDAARTDPGSLPLLARDVDAQPSLGLAQTSAADGGGVLWAAKDGAVLYADAEHRRASQVKIAFDPCLIPLATEWGRDQEGLVNDIRVRYGVAPEGGEQPEYRAFSQQSIDLFGTFDSSVTTSLATEAAATDRARGILARQAEPAWSLSGVSIGLEDLGKVLTPAEDEATTKLLLEIEMHDLISVVGMLAGSPMSETMLWVEGWTEEISYGSWRLSFVTSDYCRTAPEPRWDDVDASYTWDTVPDVTWDSASCLPPPIPTGTWDDIPATLRWDQIDASITWDTWE